MTRPKHRQKPSGTYFVTTNTWERRALFAKSEWAAIVEEKIFEYRGKGFYRVHSYVIMPDHLHIILTPGDSTSLEKAVQLIKGGASYDIGKRFGSRLPIWQLGFTEHQVRNQTDYEGHTHYIDLNPVKARLVNEPEEYAFGAARGKFILDSWSMASAAKAPTP